MTWPSPRVPFRISAMVGMALNAFVSALDLFRHHFELAGAQFLVVVIIAGIWAYIELYAKRMTKRGVLLDLRIKQAGMMMAQVEAMQALVTPPTTESRH